MKIKRSIKLTAAFCSTLLAAISLVGCSKKPVDNSIHIGVMYSSDVIPLAIMDKEDLDEKHGFDLKMEVFSSAKDRDAALQAGELDAVFTDYIGVCMYQNAGLDVKITGVTDGDYFLVAGKDTGIKSLADAAGRSIAISENTLIEYTLDSIVTTEGQDENYLKKEVVPRIPDRLEMLRNGKIDLGLLPEPFSTLAQGSGAVYLGSANEIGLYPAVSAFTGKALSEKKEVIKDFYLAYDEAIDYIEKTPLESYEDTVIEAAGYPKELKGQIVLPTFRKHRLPDNSDLENSISWAAKKGLCKETLKPEDLVAKDLDK